VARSVVVIGLGRFGAALALELERSGTEVLGIDIDAAAVSALSGDLTQVVEADAALEETATEVRLADFDRVVVAIGGDIVASCLASAIALGHGLDVWAKAISEPHARILTKLGVEHVVFPERDMGHRVAHRVRGGMLDYVQFSDDYAIVMVPVPAVLVDVPLGESSTPARHDVAVVAVADVSGRFVQATPRTVPGEGARMIVAGGVRQVERFTALASRGTTPRRSER
jgi:trk system potassium uptake protein